MLEATFWGLVGGFALIVGAVAGLTLHWPRFAIGLVSSFGSGVLLSVAAFELTQKAYETGGADVVALGVAGGALTFFVGDWLVERAGARKRKRSGVESHEGSNSTALVLGALLDGVPESAAIGITLLGGGGVGVSVVVAVFLSNIPESLASATGMRAAGRSTVYIIVVWSLVACASGLAAGGGYSLLGGASPNTVGLIQTFAAGAILSMLASTMMPEAFEEGGSVVGLVTALGFAASFLLSTLE